jgi:hypothetical protein
MPVVKSKEDFWLSWGKMMTLFIVAASDGTVDDDRDHQSTSILTRLTFNVSAT